MRHVAVVGALGFIGSHLVERLLRDEENELFLSDTLLSNTIAPADLKGWLGDGSRCITFTCLPRTLPPGKIDQIYHLASIVGPVGVLAHAGQIAPAIVQDVAWWAEAAADRGAALLYSSTSEIYSGGVDGLCDERMARVIPAESSARVEYAAAKIAAEVLLQNRAARQRITIVRPFNVAGPRQRAKGGFVLPRFVLQAISGQPLTLYGDGSAIRAFTHVVDIVEGLTQVMERGESGAAYNLGNPRNRISITALARKVVQLTGSRSPIQSVDPTRLFGPTFREASDKFPDDTLAREAVGWNPSRDLTGIIAAIAKHFLTLPPDELARCLDELKPVL